MKKLSFIIFASLLPLLAVAESVTVDNVVYELNDDGTATATGHTSAFKYTDFSIPSTVSDHKVTKLGKQCFIECEELKSIQLPDGITEIGEECFTYCKKLESINLPESISTLSQYAFSGCWSLSSVKIPSKVTAIGRDCFADCHLTSVTIPASLTSIAVGCFSGNMDLDTIVVEAGNPVYDSRDNSNAIIHTATNVMIAGSRTTIIPLSVTTLDNGCFAGIYMTSIDIPESITTIGQFCFEDCQQLTSITIPKSVTNLGDRCFRSCYNMTTVTCLNPTPPTVTVGTFYDPNPNQLTLYVPEQSVETYKATPVWQEFNIQPIKTNVIDDLQVTEASGDGKFIKDGQVIIRHGGRLYNVNGQVIK